MLQLENFLEKVDWKWGEWRPRIPQAPEGCSCGTSPQAEAFARHARKGTLTPGLTWGCLLQASCYNNLCRGAYDCSNSLLFFP